MCVHRNLKNLDVDDFLDSCEYESPNKKIANNPGDLKLIQLNVRGLNSKLQELNSLMKTCIQPDAFLLSETWLKKHSPTPTLHGYNLERTDRTRKKGGGVCIFIRNTCCYRRLPDLETENGDCMESCFIEIQTGTSKMILGSIYQPPNTNPNEFISKFQRIVAKARNQTNHLAIGLDHNLDLLKCDLHKPTQSFLEMLYEVNMIPTITKPTRLTSSSATLIDNILLNIELCANTISGIIEDNISDHLPCFNIIEGLSMSRKVQLEVTSRDIRPKQLDALKRKLKSNPGLLLPQHGTNTNQQFDKFHDTLLAEINYYLPIRTRRINPMAVRQEEWVSSGLLISIRKCKKLYRKHLRNKEDPTHYQRYKKYNAKLKQLKRLAKRLHYEGKCNEHKNNTKKLWKTINRVVRKTNNKTETVDSLKVGNLSIFNEREIANEFAKYFSNVGKDLAENMAKPQKNINKYLQNVSSNVNSIYLNPIIPKELETIIDNLQPKLSSGLDNVNNKIIKELKEYIVIPLTTIFNNSLVEGIFPEKMKTAKVVPLYKAKERSLTTNYRPISLLLTISKLLEKVIYGRVYSFLNTTKQLYVSQYGFRRMHSCEHAVGELIAGITKGLEQNKYTAGIFLDLSKAFDTLEHEVVFKKLDKYGLRGNCMKWFKSYLGGRSLVVECKTGSSKTVSNSYPVQYGTPQGSCLGPLIFLIFCNDLQKALNCFYHAYSSRMILHSISLTTKSSL